MKTKETLTTNFWLEDTNQIAFEIGVGKKENSRFARKYIIGDCKFKIDYVGDKWETNAEFTICDLRFLDENINEIQLREVNKKRIIELLENDLNDMDLETMEQFGVDPDRVIFDNSEPSIYSLSAYLQPLKMFNI